MERREEEWKGRTTAHKVTDCLVAESSLCPSFLDIFSHHTCVGGARKGSALWMCSSESPSPAKSLESLRTLRLVVLPNCPLLKHFLLSSVFFKRRSFCPERRDRRQEDIASVKYQCLCEGRTVNVK